MCGIACASPAPPPTSSRAARCARSIASAAAFRVSSTSSAIARCSAPTPRICTRCPASLVRRAGAEVFDQDLSPRWMPLLIGGLALAVLVGQRRCCCGAMRPERWRPLTSRHYALRPPRTPAGATAAVEPARRDRQRAAATPAGSAAAAGARPPTATAPPPTLAQLLAMNRSSTDTDTAFAAAVRPVEGELQPRARPMAAARRWHRVCVA